MKRRICSWCEKVGLPGAEVDAKDSFGLTALLFAAANGHADVAQMLIDAGAVEYRETVETLTLSYTPK